jgi:hypothetical protein
MDTECRGNGPLRLPGTEKSGKAYGCASAASIMVGPRLDLAAPVPFAQRQR